MTDRIGAWPVVQWVHGGFFVPGPPPDPEKVQEWLDEAVRLLGLDQPRQACYASDQAQGTATGGTA